MKKRILAILLAAFMVVCFAACGNQNTPSDTTTASTTDGDPPTSAIGKDREGNPITLPDKIGTIIAIGASNGELLVELGFGDKIIAVDEYSYDVAGIKNGLPMFSMDTPDCERIIELEPDVGDDPAGTLIQLGYHDAALKRVVIHIYVNIAINVA